MKSNFIESPRRGQAFGMPRSWRLLRTAVRLLAWLTLIAILAATPLPDPPTKTALRAQIVAAVKQVASELRNTPAVCRKSYINPVVFDAWAAGRLGKAVPADSTSAAPRKAERLALSFLRSEARRASKRKQHESQRTS